MKTAKNIGFCEELFSENDFEAVLPLSVVMNMVSTFLRQFRRSSKIKNSITKAPRVLQSAEYPRYTYQLITVKKGWLLGQLR